MKKKLFITLLIMTALSCMVSFQVFSAMKEVTFKLENIISIYKVQTIREKLGFQLRKIQDALAIKDTPYKIIETNSLINEVEEMDSIMRSCFDCHHEPEVHDQLQQVNRHLEEFKSALSRVFTLRADTLRYLQASRGAYNMGDRLLWHVDEMLAAANAKLEKRSSATMAEVLSITKIITIALFVLPIFLLVAGLYFLGAITRPISALVDAATRFSQGDLDFRVKGLHNEFGKLGDSFNVMAGSLANQVQIMQRAEQMTVVGQMAAGLAHEIKNPLAGIKVSMEVLKKEEYLHDRDRQVLTMVVAVINRVNSLINDLLNFARPKEPQVQALPLNALLQEIIASVTCSLTRPHDNTKQSSVQCHADLAQDLPNVSGDPGQLQQVFLNLIINAFDAMPRGGTATISSSRITDAPFVVVTITDTGPGMTDDVREKIFMPFFSTKKKGTGLGLAICKTLIEKSGGKITANKSIDGSGASFSVFLPIANESVLTP
jgi:signal transduction histidine kinase